MITTSCAVVFATFTIKIVVLTVHAVVGGNGRLCAACVGVRALVQTSEGTGVVIIEWCVKLKWRDFHSL